MRIQVDRSTRRAPRVPAHGSGCYRVVMFFSATMRLVGLLVIVGVVAGCWGGLSFPFVAGRCDHEPSKL